MNHLQKQGEFLSFIDIPYTLESNNEIFLTQQLLEDWQKRIHQHQYPLFNKGISNVQSSLFQDCLNSKTSTFNPLQLTPLSINFWRLRDSNHNGPAIYFVMDKPKTLNSNLILYIGETIAAEKRWKGEHDCKQYIYAYEEALKKAGLTTQLSIRFWTDVPKETKSRRKLERQLIQSWLPPFNKETRGRWATPFTAQIS